MTNEEYYIQPDPNDDVIVVDDRAYRFYGKDAEQTKRETDKTKENFLACGYIPEVPAPRYHIKVQGDSIPIYWPEDTKLIAEGFSPDDNTFGRLIQGGAFTSVSDRNTGVKGWTLHNTAFPGGGSITIELEEIP